VQGRTPGRILKRLWTPHEGSKPLARTIVLTSATLATQGFNEGSRWKAIEIATGADPSWGRPNSRVTSRQIGQSIGRRASMSRSKRPYGLT
jgi:hypothetical protein